MTDSTAAPAATAGPFSRFEWMIAGRYLRSRRKETFISVISWLTLIGVAIGVATLIVVMSVMNGFRAELLTKILGLNGHFTAYPIDAKFTDYDETAVKLETVNGVLFAVPYVEGQALASGQSESTGVSVRGIEQASIDKLTLLKDGAVLGGWDQWDGSQGKHGAPKDVFASGRRCRLRSGKASRLGSQSTGSHLSVLWSRQILPGLFVGQGCFKICAL